VEAVFGGCIICGSMQRWIAMKTFLILLCLVAAPALAAPGVMLKDEDLRAAASATAASAGRLAKGTQVDVLQRNGGWTQVGSRGRTGWVRILSVRATAPGASGAGLGGLVEAGTRRGDAGRVVAVAGLRGLNEEELKAARFDANQLMNLDRYQANRAAAEQYAREVGLRPRGLDYLPSPQREKSPEQPAGSSWGEGGLL
jgi:hypothetical protein